MSISHYVHLGFPLSFDYVGTRDVTGFLSTSAALDFIAGFGVRDVQQYLRDLSGEGARLLRTIGAAPIAPSEMYAAMRTYRLPQSRRAEGEDAQELTNGLWDEHHIQIAASVFQEQLLLRLSAQIYVGIDDYRTLVDILEREGWLGK